MKNVKRALNKPWSKDSKTEIVHMDKGDFYASELSYRMPENDELTITQVDKSGKTKDLKKFKVLKNEVVDSSVMNVRELKDFYKKQFKVASDKGILLSLHLKATMMKISDPVIFGHAVSE